MGVYDPIKNYNVLINGHGTGFAPPSDASYDQMVGSLQILDAISPSLPLRSSVDLSTDHCFPIVGDQMGQGSCAAWAATYYATGYVIAKTYNWTHAHLGYKSQLLSPAWTYNKCNGGSDGGSGMWENMNVAKTVGVARLLTMPYDDSDPVSWGDETAWRDAPAYRAGQVYTVPHNITTIKAVVARGFPITFALDANSFANFGSDDVLGSNDMTASLNHGNTIVGYDDAKIDLESGEIGAFKMVNSWGYHWGPELNGYYWMTYQAFLGAWNSVGLNYVDALYVNGSSPKLLGVWTLDPAPDRSSSIHVGIGSHGAPLQVRHPIWNGGSNSMHPYPEFMCLDITEFLSSWTGNVSEFFLEFGYANHSGNITSFHVEYFKDAYTAGYPTCRSPPSPNVPLMTPGYVAAWFRDFDAITVNIAKYGIGAVVTMKNTGSMMLWNIPWSIISKGHLLLDSGETDGAIPSLAAGQSVTITKSVFGVGKITVEARCNDIENVSKTVNGYAFLMFTFGMR
jgi:hypothetical protein